MLHNDLPFLLERRKRKKVSELVGTIEDKEKYVVHISGFKEELNHGLKLKMIHGILQLNQKAWLNTYIEMNTKLTSEAKIEFEKDFFRLMNNSVFGKTIENLRKQRDIKLVTDNKQRNKLLSEPNYHTIKYISKDFLKIKTKKVEIFINNPIYLG